MNVTVNDNPNNAHVVSMGQLMRLAQRKGIALHIHVNPPVLVEGMPVSKTWWVNPDTGYVMHPSWDGKKMICVYCIQSYSLGINNIE